MGIKNLNTLLKEHCDDAITIQPLSNWSGKRIAIDLTNIIYIHMATAWKEVVNETKVPFDEPDMDKVRSIYLSRFKQYLMRILGCKITPVIVCDGPPPPEKETITRAKRRDDRENARVRCEEFKSLLLEKDPLDIMPSDIETLRKYMRANTPVFTNDIEIVKEVCAVVVEFYAYFRRTSASHLFGILDVLYVCVKCHGLAGLDCCTRRDLQTFDDYDVVFVVDCAAVEPWDGDVCSGNCAP